MLITQQAQVTNTNHPWILEIKEAKHFGLPSSEQDKKVPCTEEALPYNQLPEKGKQHALITDSSCHIMGINQNWEAAIWITTWQVAEATARQIGSSQFAELKAIQMALDITV